MHGHEPPKPICPHRSSVDVRVISGEPPVTVVTIAVRRNVTCRCRECRRVFTAQLLYLPAEIPSSRSS